MNVGVTARAGVFYGVYPGEAEFALRHPHAARDDARAARRGPGGVPRRRGRRRSASSTPSSTSSSGIRRPRSTPAHPLVTALREASGIVLGDERPVGVFPGATDAPHFQLTAGIPTVAAFGPGFLPRAHAPNESAPVAGILQAAELYALAARRYVEAHDGRRRARARLRGRLGALPARRPRGLLPGRGRGDGRGAARRDGARRRRPRGARAAHAPRRVRRRLRRAVPGPFAAIGVQGPGPVDVDAYRRRREASGLQGLRLFALGDRAGELDAFPLLEELARQRRQALVLRRPRADAAARARARAAAGADGRAEPPRLLADRFHADEHGRPRFDTTYTRRGSRPSRGLARFPRVHVLCTGMYAFAAEPCPYDDLRPVTARAARRVRPAAAAARLGLPVDPRGARLRRDDRRGRRAPRRPRRGGARARPRRERAGALLGEPRRALPHDAHDPPLRGAGRRPRQRERDRRRDARVRRPGGRRGRRLRGAAPRRRDHVDPPRPRPPDREGRGRAAHDGRAARPRSTG